MNELGRAFINVVRLIAMAGALLFLVVAGTGGLMLSYVAGRPYEGLSVVGLAGLVFCAWLSLSLNP